MWDNRCAAALERLGLAAGAEGLDRQEVVEPGIIHAQAHHGALSFEMTCARVWGNMDNTRRDWRKLSKHSGRPRRTGKTPRMRPTMTNLTEAELKQAAHALIGDDLASMTFDQLLRLITVDQYITDITLNEIEARGEMTFPRNCRLCPTSRITASRPCWTATRSAGGPTVGTVARVRSCGRSRTPTTTATEGCTRARCDQCALQRHAAPSQRPKTMSPSASP